MRAGRGSRRRRGGHRRARPGAAEAEGITGRDLEVVDSLVTTGYAIILGDDPDDQWYGNGRHRVAALLDAGVRRTIVTRLGWLNPATGQPDHP